MNIDIIQLAEGAFLIVSVTVNVILSLVYKKTCKNTNDLEELKDYINAEFAKLKQELPSMTDVQEKIELAVLKHEKECIKKAVDDDSINSIIGKHERHCEWIRKTYPSS